MQPIPLETESIVPSTRILPDTTKPSIGKALIPYESPGKEVLPYVLNGFGAIIHPALKMLFIERFDFSSHTWQAADTCGNHYTEARLISYLKHQAREKNNPLWWYEEVDLSYPQKLSSQAVEPPLRLRLKLEIR